VDALNPLIDAAKGAADAAARQQAVRAALGTGQAHSLSELETAAVTEFQRLSEPGDNGYSDEAMEQMGLLMDVVDAIHAESAHRTTSAARVAEMSNRLATSGTQTQEPDPAEPAAPAESAPAEPAEPAAPAEPAPTEPQLVTAAAATSRAVARVKNSVPLATLPKQLPDQNGRSGGNPYTITAAADLPGINLGASLDDLDGLTEAVMARFGQLGRAGGDIGGSRAGIGAITTERDERLTANTQHDYSVVEYACNESRLPGGSLLAAGTPGWCAPGEVSYEFCPVAVVDGLIDVPTVTARRGTLIYPQSPQFHTIYSGTGWAFTGAQIDNMQLATPDTGVGPAQKPCYKIVCPDTTSLTLDAVGLCLQASILHERAYPELIRYTVQQALVAHAHQVNARVIREMEALATAVTLAANGNLGPGATATVLEGIELQVEWLRYRHRLGINQTIEMVAPVWLRGILRADLSKRMGVDLLNVNDATLNQYLTLRGVRVQWVLDWQDSFSDPATTGDPALPVTIPQSTLFGGGAAPQTAWPTTVKVLLYPAGTYFLARMDIINLEGGLLDSALLRRNERMVLFTEEAMKVGKRCYQSSVVTLPLCASGQTGSGAWTTCATAPKVAA
jgi:hypothetical protein